MNQEKVSVIVPIYNVEAYINRCLDSLVGQTYQNIEIIMVDDCSTDSSAEIAKKYAAQHPEKFRFVQREKNGGLSAARNTGIDHVAGEWLAFVDSDDWVTEDYISAMYETAQQDGADIVYCDYTHVWEDGRQNRAYSLNGLTTACSIQQKVAYLRNHACAKLYRKSFFMHSGLRFPVNVKRAEDMGITIPLLTRTEKVSILDQSHYLYFQRSNSLSNTNDKSMDLSFYPIAFRNLEQNVLPGFETEVEFRAISEMVYGMIVLMIRSKQSKEEMAKHLNWFEQKYPAWTKNPYLSNMVKGKKIFVKVATKRQYWLLKLLVSAWDRKQKSSR